MRRLSWLVACVLACARADAGDTELARVATAMAPGTWAALHTIDIDPVLQAGGASGIVFGYTDYIKWDRSDTGDTSAWTRTFP